jgi:peptidoglycan hydrolase CwlO-like protein
MNRCKMLTSVACLLVLFVGTTPAHSQSETDSQSKREDYENAIEKKLKEFGERLKTLKVEAEKAAGKAKIELQESIEELQKKMAAANEEWEKFKASSAEAWARAKNNMDAAMRDLQRHYDRLTARFKKSNPQEQS